MANATLCLYCGDPCTNIGKGEHIYPKSIGGQKTLTKKNVCTDCNNTVLAELDDDLAYSSYLSLLACQELNKVYGSQWDIDPEGTLTEANSIRSDTGEVKLLNWPQMTLEEKGFAVRGDAIESEQFGHNRFRTTVMEKAKQCYKRF